MITDCLWAAGITTVVWIDDFFAHASRDELAEAIRVHLKRLKQVDRVISGGPFMGIDLKKTEDEIADVADELMEPLSEIELAEAERDLASLSGSTNDNSGPQPDLSPNDFAELKTAFGPGLRTFSLGQWTSAGITEFEAAAEETLFLVDKDFGREGGAMSGNDVLKDLVTRTKAFCIMLTHTCKEGEQDERRMEIARTQELDAFRFSVVSKLQIGDWSDIDARFARAIYAVMTHRFTGEIAKAISQTVSNSANTTSLELSKQSVFDLDQALFENSTREGVPEFDVVLRIFRIRQRQAINDTLRQPDLQKRLRAARRFRKATVEMRKMWPPSGSDMATFREWRRFEVLEDGAPLNQLHAALACGDVFESAPVPARRYIFLAQPCDLMVRENGKRRNEVGYLAQVVELDILAASSAATGRYYDIKGVFGADRMWRVDFQKITVVNTSVIDLCVFNADGVLRLTRHHPEPGIALPNGWQIRFQKIDRKVFTKTGITALRIGMGANVHDLMGKVDGDTLAYPLARTGRLEPSTATAILAAWANFQARSALEHDFARPPLTDWEIRMRAHAIWENKQRAGISSTPEEDWNQAERELDA